MSAAEILEGAQAVRRVMDKQQAMAVSGSPVMDLTAQEGAELIKQLGQGFIAALSMLRDVRNDLRQGTCPTCEGVARALGGMPHDDVESLFRDLE